MIVRSKRERSAVGDLAASLEGATRPVKHSFAINGHRTSVSLEQAFWTALKTAAHDLDIPVAALVARIDRQRGTAGLSSAIRVWLLVHARGEVLIGDNEANILV